MAKPIPRSVDAPKFWARVDVGAADECWPWLAKIHHSGYGQFKIEGKDFPAHRVAFVLWHGADVDPALVMDHLCRNRACCNPSHLEPVTNAENIRRGETGQHSCGPRRPQRVVVDGIAYCSNWHPVAGENIIIARDLRRGTENVKCRGCALLWRGRTKRR